MRKHEEDIPSVPAQGRKERGEGCDEFKKEADHIAYGQAGKSGCKADQGKIKAQMKTYGWSE